MNHHHAARKQTWQVGQQVKVGFLSLMVVGQEGTPGDGLPNAWLLMDASGSKHYRFIPHNGIERIH